MDNYNTIIQNTSFDICLYKKNCFDSVTSFWIIKKWGKNKQIYNIEYTNNDDILSNKFLFSSFFINKNILILNIYFNKDIIEKFLNHHKSLFIIDNKKINLELFLKYKLNINPKFNLLYKNNQNTNFILWNILQKNKEIPDFICQINEYNNFKILKNNSYYFIIGWKDFFQNKLNYDTMDYVYNYMINKSNLFIKNGKKKCNNVISIKNIEYIDSKNNTIDLIQGFTIGFFTSFVILYLLRRRK